MFDKLAHCAESQRIDKVAATDYSENSSNDGKHNNKKKNNRSGNVSSVQPDQRDQYQP